MPMHQCADVSIPRYAEAPMHRCADISICLIRDFPLPLAAYSGQAQWGKLALKSPGLATPCTPKRRGSFISACAGNLGASLLLSDAGADRIAPRARQQVFQARSGLRPGVA